MQQVCQHCQSEISVDRLANDTAVCPACGSSLLINSQEITAGWLPEGAPKRIGKFALLEHLGTGSFGAVYKARDTELDRTVAIKIPRAGRAPAPQDTERFLREARNAAALRHPCIVDLYDAGQIDGTCYLVSEYIQGTTLAERLSAKRYNPRQAAELLAQVADALEYAHKQGVIHRDIKPSNIMLDLEGRPHVMDFGLAKRASDEIHLTLEGQVLGTPAYMSPEQAKGEIKRIDARSDIYCVGVIFYELLTGELPFRGQTRMLLAQVIQDEPRPPRRLNDRVPRDLETICLKAMAKGPTSRYASASEFAADLRRFLNGEPILARPVGVVERLWRWTNRRPAAAALIGVTSFAALGLLLGSLYYNARLNTALLNEKEQQAKAELNFQKAREAVDQMLTRVGESKELEGVPQWQAYRQKLLEDALEFYQEFLRVSEEPSVKREAGRAHERVGRIYEMLGRRQPAIESVQQAILIQKQLTSEFPHEPDDAQQLAKSYHRLGYLYEASGKFAEAERNYEESLAIGHRLTKELPDNQEFQYQLAVDYRHLGFVMSLTDRKSQGMESIEKAIDLLERLDKVDDAKSSIQIALADCYGVKVQMVRENDKLAEAITWANKGMQKLEQVLNREPNSVEARVRLSWILMDRAETYLRLKRTSEASEDRKRRAALGEGQTHVDLRMGRAMALAQLGDHAAAVKEVEALAASGLEAQQSLYNTACVYSLSTVGAQKDDSLSEQERAELVEKYGKRAVELLRQARQAGFFAPGVISHVENDTDMSPLSERADFNELLTDLKRSAETDSR